VVLAGSRPSASDLIWRAPSLVRPSQLRTPHDTTCPLPLLLITPNKRILGTISTQPKNIDDIYAIITNTNITLPSPTPHQLSPAHRIDRARLQ